MLSLPDVPKIGVVLGEGVVQDIAQRVVTANAEGTLDQWNL